MIAEALEHEDGIKFNGINVTNLRYADHAVLVDNSRKKLQKMLDKLNIACKIYGMTLNVKKTKVMIVSNSKRKSVIFYLTKLY